MNSGSVKAKYFLLGFIVFVAVLFYYQSLKLPKAGYQLPRLLSSIILILVLIDIVSTVFRKIYKLEDGKKDTRLMDINKKFLFFLFFTSVYIFLIQIVGYFIMTPVYLFITFMILKSMKLLTNIIVTLVFTIFIYALFVRFLNLPVPMGFIG